MNEQLLLPMLAAEGIKSIAAVCGYTIKGKKALAVYVAVFLFWWIETTGLPNTNFRTILQIVNGVAAIGAYSFISRLCKRKP